MATRWAKYWITELLGPWSPRRFVVRSPSISDLRSARGSC